MPVSFDSIKISEVYSHNFLAKTWGYAAYQALARDVVTPKSDSKVILFVTADKQEWIQQYTNKLQGDMLIWEGPNDHFAEDRMLRAKDSGEEIHLFFRARHHTDFIYYGKIELETATIESKHPSQFTFCLTEYNQYITWL